MTDIEKLAANFRAAHNVLAADLSILNDELEAVKRMHLARIKNGVNRLAARQAELRAAIEAAPELFDSPRTQTFHGIKVGFRKGSGGIDWDDDEKVADLVKKHLADQFDVLIKTTHKPIAKALAQLDVPDLKRIACRVEATGDVVVIKPVDGEVDKLVATLLKGATNEAQKEAA